MENARAGDETSAAAFPPGPPTVPARRTLAADPIAAQARAPVAHAPPLALPSGDRSAAGPRARRRGVAGRPETHPSPGCNGRRGRRVPRRPIRRPSASPPGLPRLTRKSQVSGPLRRELSAPLATAWAVRADTDGVISIHQAVKPHLSRFDVDRCRSETCAMQSTCLRKTPILGAIPGAGHRLARRLDALGGLAGPFEACGGMAGDRPTSWAQIARSPALAGLQPWGLTAVPGPSYVVWLTPWGASRRCTRPSGRLR